MSKLVATISSKMPAVIAGKQQSFNKKCIGDNFVFFLY